MIAKLKQYPQQEQQLLKPILLEQDSESKEEKIDLAQAVLQASKDKQQTDGYLQVGNNHFCINGLLINHFDPDININNEAWDPIWTFISRHPKEFALKHTIWSSDSTDSLIQKLKNEYYETGKINMLILSSINDNSIGIDEKPFTFEDFANLFKEMDVKISK